MKCHPYRTLLFTLFFAGCLYGGLALVFWGSQSGTTFWEPRNIIGFTLLFISSGLGGWATYDSKRNLHEPDDIQTFLWRIYPDTLEISDPKKLGRDSEKPLDA